MSRKREKKKNIEKRSKISKNDQKYQKNGKKQTKISKNHQKFQ